ncbi:fluoride efflux transporter CrcB [Lysobacter tyrosinilyticus]
MNPWPFIAIGGGAALGAWARWGLGLWLNPLFPAVPLGTLAANIGGGYLIGLFLAWFTINPGVTPEIRLLLVTGFLGALTTFSTFSAEAVNLLQRQQYGWAVLHIVLHLVGSLLATVLGMWTLRLLKGAS